MLFIWIKLIENLETQIRILHFIGCYPPSKNISDINGLLLCGKQQKQTFVGQIHTILSGKFLKRGTNHRKLWLWGSIWLTKTLGKVILAGKRSQLGASLQVIVLHYLWLKWSGLSQPFKWRSKNSNAWDDKHRRPCYTYYQNSNFILRFLNLLWKWL